jgi:ketosteroid isomerase-like protein
MSQENVEIVRRQFEAWNAGDMDAFRELCDPEVVMHHVKDWPEPGPTPAWSASRKRASSSTGVG